RSAADPRELVLELPVDAGRRSVVAAGAQAGPRSGRIPGRRANSGARTPRRRRFPGHVRASRRSGRADLGSRGTGSTGAARERLALTNPVETFNEWMDEARAAGVGVPEAMTLAAADGSGRPSEGVLLRGGG